MSSYIDNQRFPSHTIEAGARPSMQTKKTPRASNHGGTSPRKGGGHQTAHTTVYQGMKSCERCSRRSERSEYGYCTECARVFCKACYDEHRTSKRWRDHAVHVHTPHLLCEEHKLVTADYCRKCAKLVCRACVEGACKKHAVEGVEHVAANLRADVTNVRDRMQKSGKHVAPLAEIESSMTGVRAGRDDVKKQFAALREALAAMETHVQKLEKQLDEKTKLDIDALERYKSKVVAFREYERENGPLWSRLTAARDRELVATVKEIPAVESVLIHRRPAYSVPQAEGFLKHTVRELHRWEKRSFSVYPGNK